MTGLATVARRRRRAPTPVSHCRGEPSWVQRIVDNTNTIDAELPSRTNSGKTVDIDSRLGVNIDDLRLACLGVEARSAVGLKRGSAVSYI